MESRQIIVNGNSISEEEFNKLQQDNSIKLKLIEGTQNEYKTLTKLYG